MLAGARRRQSVRRRPLHERHARGARLGARARHLPGDRRGRRASGGAPGGGAMNLADLLFATAERHSPRRAVTDVRSGRSVSYGQLAREAERVAAFLKAEGVEPGQRIGLLAPNDLTYIPAAFGLLAAGACFVPLASNLTPTEIAEIVREVQLNGCLAWPKAAALPSSAGRADAPEV